MLDPGPACGVPNDALCAFRLLRADDTISLNRGVRADRPLLPKLIRWRKISGANEIILTVQGAPPIHRGIGQVWTMLTVITGILIVLSIGILVAHALDGFRPDGRD
jgi:hypothetical protein